MNVASGVQLVVVLCLFLTGSFSCAEGRQIPHPAPAVSEDSIADISVGGETYHLPKSNLTLATAGENGDFIAEGMLPSFREMQPSDYIGRGGAGLRERFYVALQSPRDQTGFDDDFSHVARRLSTSKDYHHRVEGCLDAYRAIVRPDQSHGPIENDDSFIPRCGVIAGSKGGLIRCTPSAYDRVNPTCSDTFSYRGNELLIRYSINYLKDWEVMRQYAVCKLDGLRVDNFSTAAWRAKACGI